MLARLARPNITGRTPVGSGTVRSGNQSTPSRDISAWGERGTESVKRMENKKIQNAITS